MSTPSELTLHSCGHIARDEYGATLTCTDRSEKIPLRRWSEDREGEAQHTNRCLRHVGAALNAPMPLSDWGPWEYDDGTPWSGQ